MMALFIGGVLLFAPQLASAETIPGATAPGATAAEADSEKIAPDEKVPVALRVEQQNVMPAIRLGPHGAAQVHHRGLNIHVFNHSHEVVNLKVRYVIFGREMVHHDVVTISEGEIPVMIKPITGEDVKVAPVSATEIPARAKAKASGASIIGHGVQVLNGGKIVAETYEPPSMKESFGKTIRLP